MSLTDTLPARPTPGTAALSRHLNGTGTIWAAIAVVLAAVITGTLTFGIAFLAMSALTAVPAVFVALILITRG